MRLKMPSVTLPRKLQFSLRTLFASMTAVSVLLGLGFWLGWPTVTGVILGVTKPLQIAVTFWPVVIGVLWLFEAEAKIYGRCVLFLASFFLFRFLVVVAYLEAVAHDPMGLDRSACEEMVLGMLNWTVPSVAVGLAIGLYFGLTARTTLAYLVGCFLTAVALLGSVWFAQRADWLLGPLEIVWWVG